MARKPCVGLKRTRVHPAGGPDWRADGAWDRTRPTQDRMASITTPASLPDPARLASIGPALLDGFMAAGYRRIEPSILQDASAFLELGGEDIRARLYLTADGAGRELCLRPEYTIPACRDYLASPEVGAPAAFCYLGPVFRQRDDGPGEFVQAGLESFGRTDEAAADAEILALALEAVASAEPSPPRVTLGDAGLFARFLDALAVPPLWQRRLKRGLERGEPAAAILGAAPGSSEGRSGLLAALAGADGRDARALVEDLLSIAGITAVGGRSVGEISERFLAQVAERSHEGFGEERQALVTRFLKVRGDPDAASSTLRRLAAEAKLDLGGALDLFDQRTGFMAAHGVEVETLSFESGFGRNLDYYTGFVFEARRGSDGEATSDRGGDVLIGGGRYDGLAQALGSAARIPAVGASIWVERLAAGGSAA